MSTMAEFKAMTDALGVHDDCPACGYSWPACQGLCVDHYNYHVGGPGPHHGDYSDDCEGCRLGNPTTVMVRTLPLQDPSRLKTGFKETVLLPANAKVLTAKASTTGPWSIKVYAACRKEEIDYVPGYREKCFLLVEVGVEFRLPVNSTFVCLLPMPLGLTMVDTVVYEVHDVPGEPTCDDD